MKIGLTAGALLLFATLSLTEAITSKETVTRVFSCNGDSCRGCVGSGIAGCAWCKQKDSNTMGCMKRAQCDQDAIAITKKKSCTNITTPMFKLRSGQGAEDVIRRAVSEELLGFLRKDVFASLSFKSVAVAREVRNGFEESNENTCPSCDDQPRWWKIRGGHIVPPPGWEMKGQSTFITPQRAECLRTVCDQSNQNCLCEGLEVAGYKLTRGQKSVMLISFAPTSTVQDGAQDVAWWAAEVVNTVRDARALEPLFNADDVWRAFGRFASNNGCSVCGRRTLKWATKGLQKFPKFAVWLLKKILQRSPTYANLDVDGGYILQSVSAVRHITADLFGEDKKPDHIIFAGHSMGGTLGQIMAVVHQRSVDSGNVLALVTGSPGIENVMQNYASALSQEVGGKGSRYPFLFNFVAKADLVPTIGEGVGFKCTFDYECNDGNKDELACRCLNGDTPRYGLSNARNVVEDLVEAMRKETIERSQLNPDEEVNDDDPFGTGGIKGVNDGQSKTGKAINGAGKGIKGANDDPFGTGKGIKGANDDPFGTGKGIKGANDDPFGTGKGIKGANDDPFGTGKGIKVVKMLQTEVTAGKMNEIQAIPFRGAGADDSADRVSIIEVLSDRTLGMPKVTELAGAALKASAKDMTECFQYYHNTFYMQDLAVFDEDGVVNPHLKCIAA